MQQVILTDAHDNAIGVMEKQQAHRENILHRAFSILIYNNKGEMLLQQRADDKYHSGGLWTNACCSHPQPGETILEAAHRRLMEELNLQCKLEVIGSFVYQCKFEEQLYEHEFDHVLKGICDEQPILDPTEVKAFKWVALPLLLKDVSDYPDHYTFWFKEIVSRRLI